MLPFGACKLSASHVTRNSISLFFALATTTVFPPAKSTAKVQTESFGGIGLLWFTKPEFGDFILRVEWRASNADDNSGVFIRFPVLGNADPANDWKLATTNGYEIQIDDTGKNPDVNPPAFNDPLHMTGAVYKLAAATSLASRPVGQWNSYEIEARGNNIKVTLNGTRVSELTNGDRPMKGHIGLQNHHPGSRVQFRRLRIKEV